MQFYAIQVRTRAEEKFIRTVGTSETDYPIRLHFPRRRMPIRRLGKVLTALEPVFPGYVFLEIEHELTHELCWRLRHTAGFTRFLRSNQNIKPLKGRDLTVVKHFIGFGPIAEKSLVRFDEADRIVVASGPLKGLEGQIIKVDKRKGRAKIKLDLYDASFRIDLAFQVIDRA